MKRYFQHSVCTGTPTRTQHSHNIQQATYATAMCVTRLACCCSGHQGRAHLKGSFRPRITAFIIVNGGGSTRAAPPKRSAEPRAQRERTLPICYPPAGRTWRPLALPAVRDAMAETCRKVMVTAYDFQHGGRAARPGEAGTPSNHECRQATQPGPAGAAPSGRPRRARGQPMRNSLCAMACHADFPARERALSLRDSTAM